MPLKQQLEAELAKRRRRNPRYSLRAFARDLATNHASLSQILRGRRGVSTRMAHELGRRAGLHAQEIAGCCETQTDRSVVRVITSRSFRPGSRWIAIRTGIPIDAVNCSLVRLLQRGALLMESPHRWKNSPDHAEPCCPLASVVAPTREGGGVLPKAVFLEDKPGNALGYREMLSGVPSSIDGGVWPTPPESTTFVQLFVEVEDVDRSIAKAEKLGAKVLVPKSVLPDGDTMAVLQDPTGMSFGICRLRSRSTSATYVAAKSESEIA